jgi:protein-disulfide isomerase
MHLMNFLKMINKLLKIALVLFAFSSPVLAKQDSGHVIGETNANITIEIFASMTCPHCAKVHLEVLPGIIDNFTKNGKAKVVLKDFPLDLSALNAAKISKCIATDSVLKFHDAIYSKQSEWMRGNNIDEVNLKIKKIASSFGIDDRQFESCLANKDNEEMILKSRIEAKNLHNIDSTPTIIINNKKYTGNFSVKDISKYINKIK